MYRRQRSLGRKFTQSDEILLQIGFVVVLGNPAVAQDRLKFEQVRPGHIGRLHQCELARGVQRDGEFALEILFTHSLKRGNMVRQCDEHELKIAVTVTVWQPRGRSLTHPSSNNKASSACG